MQLRSATTTPANDDIHAIIGRFESWAGTHQSKGVKEISYEQALKSSRFRRSEPVLLDSAEKQPETMKHAATVKQAPASPGPSRKGPEPSIAPAARTKQRGRDGSSRAKNVRVPRTAQKFQQTLAKAISEAAKSPTARTAADKPKAPILAAADTGGRAVMLSVRISPSEQALIRARAEEASLSISAYMRQCALEVEQLRQQVRLAMERMEKQRATAPAVLPVLPTPRREGLFARVLRLIAGRVSTGLEVRA